MDYDNDIEAALRRVIARHRVTGARKTSRDFVEPAIMQMLTSIGYRCVGQERGQRVYPPGVPTWRDSHGVQSGSTRRKIDVVVYDRNDRVAALVESEDDVSNLPRKAWRTLGYAVESVAADAAGAFFRSYNSIERMAIAAIGIAHPQFCATELAEHVLALRSDDAREHNPSSIPLFVTLAKPLDVLGQRERLLHVGPRLRSLGCVVIARPTNDATVAEVISG